MSYVGYLFLLIGAAFYALGGLGLLRMPDVFNRSQAGTKATTLGSFSLLIGFMFLHPSWILKLLVIMVFIGLTNPISSSILARAAYLSKVEAYGIQVDEIKSHMEERSQRNGN